MLVILGVIFTVSAILFIHPYATYPLSLRFFREKPLNMSGEQATSATMVFCAYNEERSLPGKIANLREIKRNNPDTQILAYSDCSADRTLDILQSHADVVTTVAAPNRTGKALGMRRLVTAAEGEILIFSDANVMLDEHALTKILKYFADPTVGGVAGSLIYVNPDESATAQVGSLYWRLEETIKRLESRCGSIMGADGSIFATRRSLYPEVPGHLLDDFIVSTSVTFHGYRLIHADDVLAYERNTTVSSEEFRRKRRIACRAFNTHRFLWPIIKTRYAAADRYKYVSHKLLRWFGLVPLTTAVASAMLFVLLIGQPWIAGIGAFVGAAAFILGRAGVGGFSAATELFLSILATFLGIVDSLRGKTYQTWAPALSRA